jgi:hypothetical protein
MGETKARQAAEKCMITRKRKVSDDNRNSEPIRKVTCSGTFRDADASEKCKAVEHWSKPLKGSSDTTDKNKATAVPILCAEDRLQCGELQICDVSRILIRLPDGTRLQKTFLCTTPIQELFDFLSQRGINISSHEVVTNFPKRSLQDLNRLVTFKDADLYPSVTVFVQAMFEKPYYTVHLIRWSLCKTASLETVTM